MFNHIIAMLIWGCCLNIVAEDVLCVIRNGSFTRNGYWLRQKQNVRESAEGVEFNGKNSVVWIKLNKFTVPMKSFSVLADIKVDALPAKGVMNIAIRPGYHNALAIDSQGRVCFSAYGRDKSRQIVFSKTKLKIGEKVSVGGVVEEVENGEYDIILYVNGSEEGRATLYNNLFNYDRDYFYLGAVNLDANQELFKGRILNLWVAEKAVIPNEIKN